MLTGHGDDCFRYPDVRLNFSSNIYGHADMRALKDLLCHHIDAIGSYPEPEPYRAERAIARRYGIAEDCVLVTNGATEAIYLVAQMLKNESFDSFECAQPTFSEYRDACLQTGLYPLTDSQSVTGGQSATGGQSTTSGQSMTGGQPSTVFWLCNPNNPTGHVTDNDAVADLAARYGMLVMDQSYEDYTHASLLHPGQIVNTSNILQIHSMTKTYAVPGLRIGYVVANAELIEKLRRLVHPWSVNSLAVLAAEWLVTHEEMAVSDLDGYLTETERLNRELNKIEGVRALPTQTNFMLAVIEHRTASELKDYLVRYHGILIRDASNFEGLNEHYFRIATQLPEENDRLLEAIRSFVQQ